MSQHIKNLDRCQYTKVTVQQKLCSKIQIDVSKKRSLCNKNHCKKNLNQYNKKLHNKYLKGGGDPSDKCKYIKVTGQ